MWFFYALLAAMFWGFDYVFAERVLKYISIPTFLVFQLFFATAAVAVFASLTGQWGRGIAPVFSERGVLTMFILGVFAFAAANILIVSAIQAKNATLSGMIEISYPIFIALYSWMIFRENQMTLSTTLGGALIFGGVFVIYYFNH